MPLGQQAKLLRVLQTGEFHPVGCSRGPPGRRRACSPPPTPTCHAEVKAGAFREDLLYRLNTVEMRAAAAARAPRGHPARWPAHFLAAAGRRGTGKPVQRFSAAALKALLEHPWPGNVRELEHCVERAVLLARGAELTAEDLVLAPAATAARGSRT